MTPRSWPALSLENQFAGIRVLTSVRGMAEQPVPDDPGVDAALSRFGLAADGTRAWHLRTMNNTVFAVTKETEPAPVAVLRVHRAGWRSSTAIRRELELLDYLAERIPSPVLVPRPWGDRDGNCVAEIAGTCYSVLDWIPGAPIKPDSGLGIDAARVLGEALGTIHTLGDGWDRQHAPLVWNAETLFTVANPALMGADPGHLSTLLGPADLDLLAEVEERSRVVFDGLEDWGVIHADFILGNCNWSNSDGQLTVGVLDFDDFGLGPRLFDLGAVLGNLADYPDSWPILGSAFLDGYQRAHPLPETAAQDLPVMMAARHVSHCLWVFGHATDQGPQWVNTHLRARMDMARDCLMARIA